MIFIAIALMPFVNDIASTRPLVAALEKQHVPPEQIALYAAPYLWTRDMPRAFERVTYATPDTLAQTTPTVIVTAARTPAKSRRRCTAIRWSTPSA